MFDLMSPKFDPGPMIFTSQKHEDERGFFEMLIEVEKIRSAVPAFPSLSQVNLLKGTSGAIRGFHGAETDANHWKVVMCVAGSVREAVLDIQPKSKTFGKIASVNLSHDDCFSLVIPPGFAHGVQSLSRESLTIYATNIPYRLNSEFAINPLDPAFAQIWETPSVLSERDRQAPTLRELAEIKKWDIV